MAATSCISRLFVSPESVPLSVTWTAPSRNDDTPTIASLPSPPSTTTPSARVAVITIVSSPGPPSSVVAPSGSFIKSLPLRVSTVVCSILNELIVLVNGDVQRDCAGCFLERVRDVRPLNQEVVAGSVVAKHLYGVHSLERPLGWPY